MQVGGVNGSTSVSKTESSGSSPGQLVFSLIFLPWLYQEEAVAMPPLTARRGNLNGWNEPVRRFLLVHALHPQEQLLGPA